MPTILKPGTIVTIQLPAEFIPMLVAAIEELPIKKAGKLYEMVVRQVDMVAKKQALEPAFAEALRNAGAMEGERPELLEPPKINQG